MHLMLALDESQYAEAIVRMVAAFPRPVGTRLTLVHILEPLEISDALAPGIRDRIARRHRMEGIGLLRRATRSLRKKYPDIKEILREGLPIYELLKLSRELRPDIIVCGTRGLQAAKGLSLGSVSQRLLSYAPCSIMLAPSGVGSGRPRKVMLATDGSRGAKEASRLLTIMPGTREVLVVTVLRPLDERELAMQAASRKEFTQFRAQILEVREKAAKRALDETVKILSGSGALIKSRIGTGHPAEAIPRIAHRHRADLLVMGSRGLTGLRAQALGSISLAVAQQAPCPVLIVKPRA